MSTFPPRFKRRRALLLATVPAAAAAVALVAGPASAATWSSSDRYASWNNSGYTIYNDVWGGGAGPQTVWANSASNWGVWSNQPNTGGIKSYPNVTQVGRHAHQLPEFGHLRLRRLGAVLRRLRDRLRHLGLDERRRDHAVAQPDRPHRPDRLLRHQRVASAATTGTSTRARTAPTTSTPSSTPAARPRAPPTSSPS